MEISAMSRKPEKIAEKFTIEDFIARSGAGESSLDRYRKDLEKVERMIGKPLAKASERDLIALKQELRKKLSGPQTMVLVRMFYKTAGRQDLREICVLKQRLKRLSPDDILTLPDVQASIDAAGSLRDKCLIALLWETGVRIHELLALDLKDLKVREGPENSGKKMYIVWFRKVKIAGEEHGGIIAESGPVLEAWLKAHPNPRPDAPLFPSWGGGRLGLDGAERIIKNAAKRAGLTKRVYCHLFRHSRATHLLRIGVPELQVKQLLGWKSNSVLLSRYAHLVDQDAYAAVLRAQGYEVPEPHDLGRLEFPDESLKPVVPMIPAVGTRTPEKTWQSTPVDEQARLLAKAIVDEQLRRPGPAWSVDAQRIQELEKRIKELEELKP